MSKVTLRRRKPSRGTPCFGRSVMLARLKFFAPLMQQGFGVTRGLLGTEEDQVASRLEGDAVDEG